MGKDMIDKKHKSGGIVSLFLITVLGRAFMTNMLVILIVAAFINTYMFFTSSSYFNVNNIEITGNAMVKSGKILNLVGRFKGKNIFLLDLKKIHDSILSNPMIKTVSIEKVYPEGINISVVERKPIALLSGNDGEYLVDEEGVLISKGIKKDLSFPRLEGVDPDRPGLSGKISASIISVGAKIIDGVGAILKGEDFILNLKDVRLPEVILTGLKKRIVFSCDRIEEGIKEFVLIRGLFADRFEQISAINLSFKNKAFITMK